jgi:hypothetical protein
MWRAERDAASAGVADGPRAAGARELDRSTEYRGVGEGLMLELFCAEAA